MRFDASVILPSLTMFPQAPSPSKRLRLAGIVAASAWLLASCSITSISGSKSTPSQPVADAGGVVQSEEKARLFGVLPIYRADIQQGNFVSKEMVAQLREGMTPEQVRFVLGTPLINDAFHAERWDYPFRIKDGKGNVTSSHVSVFFKDGRVSRFEGGDLPSEKDYLKRIAAPK